MSLSSAFRVMFFSMVLLVIIYFFLAIFAGPGVKDFSVDLVNGYSYQDAGHLEKVIVYSGGKSTSKIVVDARVDGYSVNEEMIYVARRPREIYQDKGVTKSRLSVSCEYWVINTIDSSVWQIEPINFLQCK